MTKPNARSRDDIQLSPEFFHALAVEAVARSLYGTQRPRRWKSEWGHAPDAVKRHWRTRADEALHALRRIASVSPRVGIVRLRVDA